MSNAALHGYWRLLSWEQRYDDGRVVYPMGQALLGFIHYDANGRMQCMIAKQDRPSMKGGQFTSADADKVTAYNGYFAYSGTYTVNQDRVVHHVDMSLFPNWVGGDQTRQFVLSENYLDIVARLEEGTSEARTALLAWIRDDR